MNIGIKYCGGCNPGYNRSGFIMRLQEKYKVNVVIETIKEDILYDMVIKMNGCSRGCLSESSLKYKGEILSVTSSEDFHMVCEAINKNLEIRKPHSY